MTRRPSTQLGSSVGIGGTKQITVNSYEFLFLFLPTFCLLRRVFIIIIVICFLSRQTKLEQSPENWFKQWFVTAKIQNRANKRELKRSLVHNQIHYCSIQRRSLWIPEQRVCGLSLDFHANPLRNAFQLMLRQIDLSALCNLIGF